MKRSWLILFSVSCMMLGMAACGPQPLSFLQPSYKSQSECGFVQNVYGERISWKGKLPIVLQVHNSYPQPFYASLEAAIKKWEQVAGKPLFQLSNTVEGPLSPRQEGSNVIYYMNTWEDNKAAEQARTSVYWVGDTIKEADIRINAKNYVFFSATALSPRDVHMESLLIHELGHVLGLKHRDVGGSVMATTLASQTVRATVTTADSESLKCEY